jgi:4-alpha-glucanotransferase
VRDACHARTIQIMGDLPIFVAHDSADVWGRQDLIRLDANGQPSVVAGVPPDYFSATGRLWGNPHYRWDVLRHAVSRPREQALRPCFRAGTFTGNSYAR